ncbi:MAG: DUF2794 domain-containing protein [Dongiaceae bacterium]
MSRLIRLAEVRRQHRYIYFDRRELNCLLSLHSRRVSSGEWRDYAIDHRPGMAVFSVFRHSHERPLYAIAKCAGNAEQAADYVVLSGHRRVRTASSLDEVLAFFDTGLRIVS